MKKVEAIIQQEKLEELKLALDQKLDTTGMTVTQVLGCGNQKGLKEYVRGQEIITTLLPKVVVSFVVFDEKVEDIIQLILSICQTGEVGDGKIFVSPIEEAIRIRTGERGKEAI
ncbi:P-II family nitrogen regulator [Enterococcus wangshanyuanii]|uniref:Nitrogen regulatory protein P-II n=1 Tax=Enterococcus wangshanyuanii TaxID=2005703 RepID=A0ABQ1NFN9_9ENTE|nr:P-II family nitrogen regulator [Enterococcus wangshanyuanii]GGC75690.1 nitrogen regulatory protein P-II [Enterococcus wangshanyuanii]